MSNIYRQYRPQKFAEIKGQNHLKISLESELVNNTLSHAYLFSGPRAVGKTSLARILAQAVNCENRKENESEPCGLCDSCKSIRKGKFLDVLEIDAASNTGVDNVRENIIKSVRLAPSLGKKKVFIIDEVHMLSISAFNALLKTLEEPPAHCLFILCTTEAHKVPGTIISRCERFDFKLISLEEVVEKLAKIAKDKDLEIESLVLENIARSTNGHLRDAESILGQIISLGEKKIDQSKAELILPRNSHKEALALINFVIKKDLSGAIELINDLAFQSLNFKIFLAEIVLILRQALFIASEIKTNLAFSLSDSTEKDLIKIAKEAGREKVLYLLKEFSNLKIDINSPIPHLAFEILVAELCFGVERDEPDKGLGETKLKTSKDELPSFARGFLKKDKQDESSDSKKTLSLAKDLNESQLKALWPEFLVKIKKYNHSLSFILQNSLPKSLNSGNLSLYFKYKFHRDRVLEPKLKDIVEDNLAKLLGGSLKIEAILDEKLVLEQEKGVAPESEESKESKKEERDLNKKKFSNLINSLGGELI